MKAEALLALYERVADAPDAIPRLRRFVLDLAVRGKLVEQDSADEPASELLSRIAVELSVLAKAKEIRKPKPQPELDEESLPYELPSGWAWTQIGRLGVVSPRVEADDGLPASFVPMTLIPADYGASNTHEVRPWGEIKKGYTHLAEGDVGLAKITPCFENGKSVVFRNLTGGVGAGTTELHVLRPLMANADYVVLFLKSPQFIETGIPRMTGTAGQKRVPTDYFTSSPFPLPPLAEQHRIVAKVDELMALLDRLEDARSAREATRDRLTTASLTRLTAADTDPEALRTHARFALDALPALTTRADQIKQLRQTILDLAVGGLLAEQDERDIPAEEEIKKVEALKMAQNLRKVKGIAPISDSERLRRLPIGWSWARWDQIASWITYGFTRPMEHCKVGVPIVTGKNVNAGRIILETASLASEDAFAALNDKDRPHPGDILVTKDGSIGRTAIVEDHHLPFCINQSVAVIWLRACHFERRFLKLVLDSPQTQAHLHEKTAGVAIKHISVTDVGQMLVPIPPLAEQHRIVAKVDELMALCDRLEAALQAADTTRARLLEALLHEALAGERAKAA